MSNLAITHLLVEECLQLSNRILEILQSDIPGTDTTITQFIVPIQEINHNLSSILLRQNGSKWTAVLSEKDHARDEAFRGFCDYCKSFTRSSRPELQAPAKQLASLIERFGWRLYEDGYAQETISLNLLIQELAKEENAEAVTQINATLWVEEIIATNADFEEAERLRDEQAASQEKVPLTRETRQALNNKLKPLLGLIEQLAEINPAEYGAAQSKIAEVVSKLMAAARARDTRRENLIARESLAEHEVSEESNNETSTVDADSTGDENGAGDATAQTISTQ